MTSKRTICCPSRPGIDAGAQAVLVSHNIVACLDADYPASLSPAVHALLRGRLGFDGVIMTDDLAMQAVTDFTGDETPPCSLYRPGTT